MKNSLEPVRNLKAIQILGKILLILVVTTPMLILGIMSEGVPRADSIFVTGINNNPALMPTKERRDSVAYLDFDLHGAQGLQFEGINNQGQKFLR